MDFIKILSAMILAFVVFINSIGNFIGIGDLIPTEPEVPTTAVIEDTTTEYDEPTTEYVEPTTEYVEPTTEYVEPTTEYVEPTTEYVEPTTEYVEPTTEHVESTTEYVEPTTLAPQPPVEETAQRIEIDGIKIRFGWSAQEITDAFGVATETVYETKKDGKSITSLVYASDYSKLAIFQLVDDVFSGFYTIDTDAIVTDGEKTYSIASSGDLSQSKLSIKEYKDSHQNNIVYAIYVSYNGFSVKVKDFTNCEGQSNLNFYVVNGLRALHGAPALQYCEVAENAIRLHCEDMASKGYFDHESPEGGDLADRLHAQGINFKSCAENIASGSNGNAFSFADAWYNSKAGHREGMLSTDYDHVGIAFVVADDGTVYAGQNFYRPL